MNRRTSQPERPMKRAKRKKKPVTVRAWCVVDKRGKPEWDCYDALLIFRTRRGRNRSAP